MFRFLLQVLEIDKSSPSRASSSGPYVPQSEKQTQPQKTGRYFHNYVADRSFGGFWGPIRRSFEETPLEIGLQ